MQGTHAAENVKEYDPASHAEQLDADIPEYIPAPQTKHVADEDAPNADEKVPAEHDVQLAEDDAPTITEYVPATHSVQRVDDAIENFPGSHRVHGDESVETLYVPAIHIEHNPPPAPVKPWLH
jgi:hypothetical protein